MNAPQTNLSTSRPDGDKQLRIAVVSSFTRSLTIFRLEFLKRLAERGHKVTAFGPESDAPTLAKLTEIGVDLEHHSEARFPLGPPVFLLIARLLRDKGIYDYVEASRQLAKRYPGDKSHLLAQMEPHESGISQAELQAWEKEGVVTYLGEFRDVQPYLAACSVFVLPSFYREGIPRSILEAMAIGRPIITTESPECRDTVVENENGFIVPPRNADALARAMERFLAEPELARRMGKHSRKLAAEKFDVHAVNRLCSVKWTSFDRVAKPTFRIYTSPQQPGWAWCN